MDRKSCDEEPNNRNFRIAFSQDVFTVAPNLTVGLIALPSVNNLDNNVEVNALLKHMELEIIESGIEKGLISELETISAWRHVYSQFGVKPARYHCAAEALIRRVVEHGSLPRIHTLVNLCNALSLKARIPIASCDINGVEELVVQKATGLEPYLPIGKPDNPEFPDAGEIIYTDHLGRAHSRRWNWRQSDIVKTTEQSSTMLFTIEAVHQEAKVLVEATTNLLFELLQPFAVGVDSQRGFINADSPVYEFTI
ncbi:hypothetical protein EBB07_14820 [Paenibacillaceae bacterium]|nr:hypothetical protein EBB07_14820 [Paenibacillaceae bacterium]